MKSTCCPCSYPTQSHPSLLDIRLTQFIDTINEWLGRTVAWMTCVMGVATLTIVVLRYGFDIGAIVVQEAVLYLHATSFMLGIAYALKDDEHVRVDIFYSRLTPAGKARVNLIGHILFLLPCAITIGAVSLDYVAASWRIFEGSSEVGGIPALFLLKSLIPVMALTLIAQGLAEIARSVLILKSPGHRA